MKNADEMGPKRRSQYEEFCRLLERWLANPHDRTAKAQAIEILHRQLPAINQYVFPGRDGRGHVTDMKHAWTTICKKAELEDATMHDLRRTLGSWQVGAGVSLKIVSATLGHADIETTNKVYAHLDIEPVRLGMQIAVSAMIETGNGGNTLEVVSDSK